MPSNRVFLTLVTVMGFSLIIGLAVLVIVVRTADEMPTPALIVLAVSSETTLPPTSTLTPNLTLAPVPASTSAPAYPPDCGFAWAHEDLPDITRTTQSALDAAGMMQTRARIEAFGENCIDGQTGAVRYFSAMTTDFYFIAEVEAAELKDRAMLAAFIKPLYNIAAATPRDELPAPPGYLDVVFTSTSGALHLRTRFAEAQVAIRQNLKGAALLDALGGLTAISG
jgi:hypothetical protein